MWWIAWALLWVGVSIWQDNIPAAGFAFCWAIAELQRVLECRKAAVQHPGDHIPDAGEMVPVRQSEGKK